MTDYLAVIRRALQLADAGRADEAFGVLREAIPVAAARGPTIAELFAGFWAAYPNKKGKGAARKAFERALKRATAREIAAGLNRFAWPSDRQFIPHPATWLNQDRWADEPDTAPPAPAPKPMRTNGGVALTDEQLFECQT
jgi:hypothetical protein